MEKREILWTLLSIGVLIPLVTSFSCASPEKCLCFHATEYEYQCPPGGEEYTIYVLPEQRIQVECSKSVTTYDTEIMPDVYMGDIEQFTLRFCPLPETNLKQTFEKFNITSVKEMQLLGEYETNVVYNISEEFFDGLSNLEKLTVNLGKTNFEPNTFAKVPNLVGLYLATNGIQQIDSDIFSYTPKLRVLDLSRNFISDVPDGLFENLLDLRMLHLWDNELTSLDNKSFAGLNQLKSLELSINKIEHLDENVFAELVELANISLRSNNLKNISSRIFRNNKALNSVRLGRNANLNLSDYIFANLLNLTEVNIDSSRLETIPEHLFEGSVNLKVISLSDNNIKTLPQTLFKNLVNLNQLNLNKNQLESLPNGIFRSLKNLIQLNLEDNHLTEINELLFRNTEDLKVLNLKKNKIAVIHIYAFYRLTNIIDIDLSYNQYNLSYGVNVVGLDPFGNCDKLSNLKLSFNLIDQFPVGVLQSKTKLKNLDLDHNQIGYLSVTSVINVSKYPVNINLCNNNISLIIFQDMEKTATANMKNLDALHDNSTSSTVFISHNPIACDCSNFHLIQYNNGDLNPAIRAMVDLRMDDAYCATPNGFNHISVKQLKPRHIICPLNDKGCPRECFCELRPYDKCAVVDCSKRNLTETPVMRLATRVLNPVTGNLDQLVTVLENIEVHLEDNLLETAPYNGLGYENVTRLFLSNNHIKNLSWIPPKIEILTLNGNRLTNIGSDLIHVLNESTTIRNLTLYGNPWSCGCSAMSLQNYLRNHYKKVNPNDVVCENNKLLIEKKELCKTYTAIAMAIAVPILVILCALAVAAALYFYYQEQIKVWLYAKNLCLWFVTEEELDKDKTYDIFVSYSYKDEDFVIQNLLPVLETGPNPFKICIHIRDWVPGEFIATQVTQSVLDSRRTLVVLSDNFLESVWGKMEFRTAHTQAINEGRARVVVIKYGKLNEEKLDDELKTYLKTNTYVEWGDPWFWNKLKYALPHTRKNKFYNNNQKHANIMLKIDDKFELVTSSPTIHVESTPPVMSLDPSLLKSHPLNFTSANNIATPPAEAPLMVKK